MHSTVQTYTPEQAAAVLATRNTHNRPLSRERVRRYAEEMRQGRWRLNPQGLSFGPDGGLVDGQHRLAAVQLSGLPQSFYVHLDVPPEVVRVMDQGLARTAAQLAAGEIESKVPTSRLTSAARACLEHGLGIKKPSNSQIVDYAVENAALLERYAPLGQQYTAGVHAAFAFAELQGYRYVQEAAKRLEELAWASEDDPMRALARSLQQMGTREGAKAKATRFFTTMNTLEYVNRQAPLQKAPKHEQMSTRVRESVRVEAEA